MSRPTVGIVSPGAMGSALGRAWAAGTSDPDETQGAGATAPAPSPPSPDAARAPRPSPRGSSCSPTSPPWSPRVTWSSASARRPPPMLLDAILAAAVEGRLPAPRAGGQRRGTRPGASDGPAGRTPRARARRRLPERRAAHTRRRHHALPVRCARRRRGPAGRQRAAAPGRRRRAGAGVCGQDVHSIDLQGDDRALGAGAADRGRARGARAGARRPRRRSSPRRSAALAGGSPSRPPRAPGSSPRWTTSRRPRATLERRPKLFEGMAAVYRRLAGDSPRRPDARGGRSADGPARRPHPTPRSRPLSPT